MTLDVCTFLSSLHLFLSLSVFYPQATFWLSPEASWLNVYLLGKLWLVCVCVCVCVCACVCMCVFFVSECVCIGANECVSSRGPIDHREGKKVVWEEDEREWQVCTIERYNDR